METMEDVYRSLKTSLEEKVRIITCDSDLNFNDFEDQLCVKTEYDSLNQCYYYRYSYEKFYLLTLLVNSRIDSEWNVPSKSFKVMGETTYKIYTETFSEYNY
ncbi:hypothetical protein [Elizabethkingia anophelis]|uniref:hypothetical protein n=1 Tax=Elizabethkingia anophelis TaxID=1117645 RepID=UPI0007517ADE|nr:hypothetical protein [Elizabethkingia anophelis]AQW91308.1 hypothetical protein BBD28_11870 [Elizabethkingia anophelis]KUY14174.1 hypothetical protein ATB94_09250 [Elizabethkingia anophelis]